MAETQAYSLAELSRCKLLYEVSVKDRDLRRLVGHVNMYDRLLDVLNEEETRQRDQSPPKPTRAAPGAPCHSPSCITKETTKPDEHVVGLVAAEKEMGTFEYTAHCENVSLGSQDGYGSVSVAEVEILDDDD
jgi:hypothetical protein